MGASGAPLCQARGLMLPSLAGQEPLRQEGFGELPLCGLPQWPQGGGDAETRSRGLLPLFPQHGSAPQLGLWGDIHQLPLSPCCQNFHPLTDFSDFSPLLSTQLSSIKLLTWPYPHWLSLSPVQE